MAMFNYLCKKIFVVQDEDGVGLTDEEIQEQIDTFLFEGHDTTASSITWTLYNLAMYPEHQQKCRDEVDALFDEKGEITQYVLKSNYKSPIVDVNVWLVYYTSRKQKTFLAFVFDVYEIFA